MKRKCPKEKFDDFLTKVKEIFDKTILSNCMLFLQMVTKHC